MERHPQRGIEKVIVTTGHHEQEKGKGGFCAVKGSQAWFRT